MYIEKVTSFRIERNQDKTFSYLYVTERGRGHIIASSIDELKEKVLSRSLPWQDNIENPEYDYSRYEHVQINKPNQTKNFNWKVCPNCGHQVNSISKKCPYCSYDFKKKLVTYQLQTDIDKPIYQRKHNFDTTQLYKCPRCGDLLYLKDREDESGEFYHCENCDKTYNYEHVPRFAKYHGSRSILDECPRCGSDIISKVGGPRGRFFGCVEFPTCDFAYSELLRRRDSPKQDTKNNE